MIIYNHLYDTSRHKIIINPIEVTETPKTFKSKQPNIGYYSYTIKKADCDVLLKNFVSFFSMVSTTPKKQMFIELIKKEKREQYCALKIKLDSLKEDITLLDDLTKGEE